MSNQTFLLTARARRLGRVPKDAHRRTFTRAVQGRVGQKDPHQPRQPRRDSCLHV